MLEAPDLEAERSVQVAWARLSLGDVGGSLADADRARALMPGSERYREQAGMIALRAGRPDLAVEDFRAALSFAARGDAPPERRGTLYRRIGQALDKQGKADLAYDAYKRALTLAPGESHAARRVHEMEQASGMRR